MILKSSFIRPYKGCYEEKKEENIDSELETYINEMIAKRAEQRKTKNNARRILKEKYNFSEMAEHYKAIFMA